MAYVVVAVVVALLVGAWGGFILSNACSSQSIGSKESEAVTGVSDQCGLKDGLIFEDAWRRLVALPQFIETFEKTLINLKNGDEIAWSTYQGRLCLEGKIAGHSIKFCTESALSRYMRLQESAGAAG